MICNIAVPWGAIRSMRLLRPAILLGVVPLVPVPVAAQATAAPQALEQELTRLSDEWMRGVWDKDDSVMNRLMADDFVILSPGGANKVQKRPDWLRNARMAGSGECAYSNIHVQAIGADFAIMAAELTCKGDYHGIGLEANSVVSDVWVKRDGGGWKVAARIASTSPRFTGIWAPLLIGAALPLVAWLYFAIRNGKRERNSLLKSANRF
jgi:ketosteroid isomerase-like protein